WCDEVRRLCEAEVGSSADRTPGRNPVGDEPLVARLDAIATGLRLRRQLDGLVPDEATEASRREVVRRLNELQLLADGELAGLKPGTVCHREVAARVRNGLAETRVAIQNALTVLQLEPLHQALAIEGLRADLEWLSVVVARLDGEIPPPPMAWLDV